MHAFDYLAPKSLAEAIDQLAQANGGAKPLAGGTDLIDQVRNGRFTPDLVVDIKKLPELNVLEVGADGLRVGAATPCYRIYDNESIDASYSALADACRIIGGIQIQSRASVGGNLCNSGPAADSIPAMIALGGHCVIAGPNGQREVAVEEFCTGPGANVLEAGELLVEIKFPAPANHSGSHYRRMIPRNEMDIAVVGVGACVALSEDGSTIEKARVALGAVAPTPLFASEASDALVGQEATDATLEKAAEAARAIAVPISDMRGEKEYRVHVTGVLVKRVVQAAIDRARGQSVSYRPGH